MISWEGFGWGVDIEYSNGRHKAYVVGPRDAAEKEAQRIRSGGRAQTRKQVRLGIEGTPQGVLISEP